MRASCCMNSVSMLVWMPSGCCYLDNKPKYSTCYHAEMYSNSWFVQLCGKLCYQEVYRGLLHFTIPSTGSYLYWSWEFRQQKLINGDIQRVVLHKWTVKIMAAKCVSWCIVGFLEYIYTHTYTVEPPYPQVIRSKTYHGYMKLQVILNTIYVIFM
jgi:hypothetical protein